MNGFSAFVNRWKTATKKWQTWKTAKPYAAGALEFVAIYGLVASINHYVVGLTVCVGPSMKPTIDEEGEVALINRISYKGPAKWRKNYKKDDVVISLSMNDPSKSKLLA
jgi:signal peptidase I